MFGEAEIASQFDVRNKTHPIRQRSFVHSARLHASCCAEGG